ncbi:MAG TPA: PAS domain S-box protein [Acidimicrobiia bacterium]|nr:PAS domain S-box protein [Acidimicrobiia bacterium]
MTARLGSLGVRLVLVVLTVGLMGGLVGSIVIRESARDALRNEVEAEHVADAERLAAVLEARLSGLQQSLLMLSTRRELADPIAASTELAVALRAGAAFDSFVLYGLDGTALAAAAHRELVDIAGLPPRRDLYERLAPGSSTVTTTKAPAPDVEFIVPIERPPGTIVGALVGRVPLEIVSQRLQTGLTGSDAVAFVTDGTGRILFHPERNRAIDGEVFPISRVLERERVTTLDRDGKQVLTAVATVPDLDVAVVVEQEESVALRGIGRELGKITVLLLLVVLLIVIAVLALTTRLLRPLRGLSRTVQRIAQGEPARAEVRGSSEMRAVAEEINRMAEALERRVGELQEAQRTLAETEARFRTAFDQGPVAMAIVAPDGRYQEVNPAMCALLGRSEHELVRHTRRDVTHPDDIADTEEVLSGAIRSGNRSFQMEERYLHADGRTMWVLLSVGIVNPGDPRTSTVVHLQDITEQRQAREDRETLLRTAIAAEERTNRILEAAPDATIVADADGRIAYANRQTAEMFGYAPADLFGQHVELLLPERFRERHEAHRTAFIQDPQARPMGAGLSLSGRRRDGSEFPVEVSLSPLEVDGERQVVAAVRDVTERRRAEETARTLDAMRSRQRQAVELNDNIVQGLTVAKWAFERERLEEAQRAIERTYRAAQALIQDMLREASAVDIAPGDLVRQSPAEFGP